MAATVTILIVNYRVAHLVVQSVEKLLRDPAFPDAWQIVIVDNLSDPSEPALLHKHAASALWQGRVHVLENPANSGFGAGNNVGFQYIAQTQPGAASDYIYLLNPDAGTDAASILALTGFMDTHPACGAATSRIIGDAGEEDVASFQFPTPAREFFSALAYQYYNPKWRSRFTAPPPIHTTHQTDWVSGASLMLRTRMLADVGGFDEGFFLYFEETDLLLRAARKGWQCWYVAEATAHHSAGASTGLKWAGDRPPPRPAYWYESWGYYHLINHGRLKAVWAMACILAGGTLQWLQRGVRGKVAGFAQGMLGHILTRSVPLILRRARTRRVPALTFTFASTAPPSTPPKPNTITPPSETDGQPT